MKKIFIILCVAILFETAGRYTPSNYAGFRKGN